VLRELAAEKNLEFRKKFVGRTLEAITLQTSGDGWTEALSDNYLKVRLAREHVPNKIVRVDVIELGQENLIAAEAVALSS
jgi:tRNA A37 methylthiotransferase MiaB